MRLKNTTLLACLWILVTLLAGSGAAFAQSEAEGSEGTLYIQSKNGGSDVAVPSGRSVDIKYRHNPKLYRKLVLNEVRDTSVVLGADTVGIQFIDEIGVRREKLHRAGTMVFWGSVIAILAFYLLALAGLALSYSSGGLGLIFLILTVLLAIPAGAAMPGGLIAGIVLLAVAYKRYSMYKDYQLSSKPSPVVPKG